MWSPWEIDDIDRMITISKWTTYKKSDLGLDKQGKFDPIYQTIQLTMVPLSGFYCKICFQFNQ